MTSEQGATFVLPGTWWTLDTTTSETQLVGSIKRRVERAAGTRDDRATLRRDLRTQLLDAAHGAREMGAERLYIAEEIAEGVPFAATLMVVKAAGPGATGGGVDERAAGLAAALKPEPAPVVCDFVDYPLVRVTDNRPSGDAEVPSVLKVDYWLTTPSAGEILLFAFGSPFLDLEAQVVELFDAVMTTVRFPASVQTTSLMEPA